MAVVYEDVVPGAERRHCGEFLLSGEVIFFHQSCNATTQTNTWGDGQAHPQGERPHSRFGHRRRALARQ